MLHFSTVNSTFLLHFSSDLWVLVVFRELGCKKMRHHNLHVEVMPNDCVIATHFPFSSHFFLTPFSSKARERQPKSKHNRSNHCVLPSKPQCYLLFPFPSCSYGILLGPSPSIFQPCPRVRLLRLGREQRGLVHRSPAKVMQPPLALATILLTSSVTSARPTCFNFCCVTCK